ncbi:MAG TPA: hypothetical protein VGP26_10180 [Actinophytocola sp.]|jgi:hypothetical protein|nr:hypothetical protein [Actinophytocola sp.]
MTTTATRPTSTARDALFPHRDATAALAETLNHSDVSGQVSRTIKHLSGAGHRELLRQLATATAELLDLDLTQLVAHTLRTHRALVAAGDRTAAAPGSVEIVQLQSVPVTWQRQAVAQLWLNETLCLRIDLQLAVLLEFHLEATVRGGRLVALPFGRCTVSITLSSRAQTLATTRHTLDLHTALPLGDGLPLTPGHPRRPTVE